MIDIYTKTVLTVIAAALIAIIARQAATPAKAAFGDCGETFISPCYIKVVQ